MIKSIFQSKTFRIACLQALVAVLIVFTSAYPNIGWLLLAKSALDIYLRSVTVGGVSV
jgi:hypothetical protein